VVDFVCAKKINDARHRMQDKQYLLSVFFIIINPKSYFLNQKS
jgi:hypothetical protein